MSAIRKLMLGVVAATGFLLPFGSASQAHAGNPGHVRVCHYHVYLRSCPHSAWQYFGCYPCANSARAAGLALQARGYAWWCQPI
jgi:hypothetical protein